jgi:uncharacterized membrane protein YidH (DUF202 family)
MSLNNREWALLVLLAGFGAWALLRNPELRSNLRDLARAALQAGIIVPVLLMVAYVCGLVFVGRRLGLWNPSLIKATVTWFLVSGLVILMNAVTERGKERRFFLRTALRTLELTVFVEFFINLFVLSFPAELVLQFVLIWLAMLSAFTAHEEQYRIVRTMVDGLLAVIGIGLAGYVTFQLARHWDQLDKVAYLPEFAVPVWMTIGALPFIYFIMLYARYQSAFKTLYTVQDPAARRRAKLAMIMTMFGRVRNISAITGNWTREAASAPSFRSARNVIKHFQASGRLEDAKEAEKQARLKRYAGVKGTDASGRQLDRREFEETMRVLRWLATVQEAWYSNPGRRYQADVFDVLGHDFTSYGLPLEHGITLHVARNGRSWWAWRRTVTGWCFAIGAAGPDQWEFDGPEPPRGFPGKDKRWEDGNRNW